MVNSLSVTFRPRPKRFSGSFNKGFSFLLLWEDRFESSLSSILSNCLPSEARYWLVKLFCSTIRLLFPSASLKGEAINSESLMVMIIDSKGGWLEDTVVLSSLSHLCLVITLNLP